jgi:hypothetical protein
LQQTTLIVVLFAVGVTACGSSSNDESDPKDALIGKWGVDLPGSPDCVLGGVFNADGTYEADTICPLTDGSYGVEAEIGNFSADGKTIDFVPTAASCFETDRDHNPVSLGYTVTKTTLTLARPSGAIIMQRVNDTGSGSSVVHFGCANTDKFAYSDIKPL